MSRPVTRSGDVSKAIELLQLCKVNEIRAEMCLTVEKLAQVWILNIVQRLYENKTLKLYHLL